MKTLFSIKRYAPILFLCFLSHLIVINVAYGQTTFVSGDNPIFRNSFTADPAPLVHNGRLYIYVGKDEAKDGEMFTMTAWLCYSTLDMKNWTYHGPVMTPSNFTWGDKDAWAAQVVERNGKFYLYVTVTGKNPYGGRNIGVAVSDSPTGPFVDARGTPLIRDNMTNNGKVWDDIDPTVLIDDNGQAYLCWGNPICYLVKLQPNMTEIDGEIKMITPPNYAEGPWLHKRNGLYYLTYPAFVAPVGSEQICYATATNINGPWTYRGILTGTAKNSYTIHPGIVEYKGQSYLFYHNATLTLNGQGPALGRRSVCVEYLCYNADGTIKPITQTTAGITVNSPCPPSGPPVVSFTSPVPNSSFASPASITLTAEAIAYGGTISNVRFYNGTTLLNTDNTSPYSYNWENVAAGTYNIKAIATDNQNRSTEATITIKVNPPQGPYNGIIHSIPGTIELEQFDVGGNGFAYMDGTPGSQVTPIVNFRTDEDVDIENCTDVGGGYNIGWATAGEWLEYSVEVLKPGTYDLAVRVACNGDGRTISVYMDGIGIADKMVVPNTAGWQSWQIVMVKDIHLSAGQKIMRITTGATDFVNMNYVTFTLTKELKQEPFKGIAHQIPGRIEAEEYDLGGEGIAYHEANANGNQGGANLRNDEVDIEVTQDLEGEYNIGYILNGEWLGYTVDVLATGVYVLQLKVAADGDGKKMHVEVDGTDVTGTINIPNTKGWQAWETITINDVSLKEGQHVMRVFFDSDYMNLNYLQFNDVVTGIENVSLMENSVCPNPFFNEGMQIKFVGKFNYKIRSLDGMDIETGSGMDALIIGAGLKPGVYLLSIEHNNTVINRKIIKQ
ncbi:MAG: family 43 glycosylhydrolase [Sporocytophaga sp.]|uniref:family 43 glycosylhydrolase n=1 Tax=Sporocytophaga sp. TaxID=2231183 RepID=UPI001B0438EE|nr:family 43 glycosylhydrolase [Sporocytophaga sp.]MBO9703471.1 family 43 glycosylhydrolase [Sporocytophaga sp.]